MTRDRIYGSDTPFMAWVRQCTELPSFSREIGWVQTDNDATIHCYMSPVDGLGSRQIQSMMHLEVKTRRGVPTNSQFDTLFKLDRFSGEVTVNSQTVRHMGVSILSMDGTSPDDSIEFQWGRFRRNGRTWRDHDWHPITRTMLIQLLQFRVTPWHPFAPNPFRRHHKTQRIIVVERTPLGFECEKEVVKRS